VVSPRPSRKKSENSRPGASIRLPAIRHITHGTASSSGPYIGRKKETVASESWMKLCREGWSIGVCMVCELPHSQNGQTTNNMKRTAGTAKANSRASNGRRSTFLFSHRCAATAAMAAGMKSSVA
jgi:hypothetical protein